MLALVTDAFGGQGGIAQYNRDLLSALAEAGPQGDRIHPITVVPRHAPDRVTTPNGIQQTAPRPRRGAYAVNALAIAASRKVDLVFCGHLHMAPLAALIARLKGAKLIIQTHGIEAWPQPAPLQRAAVEKADLILAVSRHTRGAVLKWAALVPERVFVVPNTVGNAFTPGDGETWRTSLGLVGKQVLLTVGRMDPSERYKGQDRVIGVLPELLARGHDVMYAIAGEGDDRLRLERLARELGVADRVRFLGGLGPLQLVQAYRMADLFVMPSTSEGFGITFLEAMACGLPAVGLSMAGARDALADGALGTVISEVHLGPTISRLLAQPKPDPKALAARVRDRFDRRLFAERLRGILALTITDPIPA